MKRGNAPGEDGMNLDIIKGVGEIAEELSEFFTKCFKSEESRKVRQMQP